MMETDEYNKDELGKSILIYDGNLQNIFRERRIKPGNIAYFFDRDISEIVTHTNNTPTYNFTTVNFRSGGKAKLTNYSRPHERLEIKSLGTPVEKELNKIGRLIQLIYS